MGFRMLRSAAALVAVVLLAGCVPGDPVVTPEPDPEVTPVFASDEEALAAATEAYARYLEVSDQIAADGGADPERIQPFVSTDRYQIEAQLYQQLTGSGNRQEGSSSFDNAELQQFSQDSSGVPFVIFYVCLDLSATNLVDSIGTNITPPEVTLRSPFEITMTGTNDGGRNLVLEGMERWPRSEFC